MQTEPQASGLVQEFPVPGELEDGAASRGEGTVDQGREASAENDATRVGEVIEISRFSVSFSDHRRGLDISGPGDGRLKESNKNWHQRTVGSILALSESKTEMRFMTVRAVGIANNLVVEG